MESVRAMLFHGRKICPYVRVTVLRCSAYGINSSGMEVMMKKIIGSILRISTVLIALLGVAAMFSGCSKPVETEELHAMKDTTWYLGCNLFPDVKKNNALSSVNYHLPGGMLKWGTAIKIVELDGHHVIFEDLATNIQYPYAFHGKTLEVVTPEEHLKRILLADIEPLRSEVASMSEIDKRGIDEGVVYPGMTKRAVLIAIGYPPEFVTPDPMTSNEWNYWYDRFREFVVAFDDDGRVVTVTGYYPPEQE